MRASAKKRGVASHLPGGQPLAVRLREEVVAVEVRAGRDDAAEELEDRAVLRVVGGAAGEQELHAGEDQEGAKDVDDPVEAGDQRRPGGDHGAAHHQRREDAPEEHPVLVDGRDAQRAEDDDEDEDVVHRERLLDDVAGQVLHPGLAAEAEPDVAAEAERQRYPQRRPAQRLAGADDVVLAVEDAQVERQHRQHEGQEG